MSIFSKVIKTVFGTKSDKDLKVLQPYVEKINKCYSELSSLSDQEIKDRLKNWDISRLAIIDKIILRMSASEMFFIDDVPPKVSIAEGVEIAKVFSTKDSSSFVNGILDAIYNDVYMKDNNKN